MVHTGYAFLANRLKKCTRIAGFAVAIIPWPAKMTFRCPPGPNGIVRAISQTGLII
jgi:hypothetical protein